MALTQVVTDRDFPMQGKHFLLSYSIIGAADSNASPGLTD
jgi:hypothetical protein